MGPVFEVFLWNKRGNPLAQGSYSIYVLFANDTGDAGQIHKRRSTLENPANPWLKVHVLASMDKLWQIFPGKWSKGKKKKKRQQNWDPFWLKSGVNVSGRQAKLMSACQELPFMLMAAMGSPFPTWRERLCLHLQKWLGLAGCFARIFQRSTSDTAVRNDATLVYLAVFPIFPLSIYCVLNFASTPSSLMFPVCLSFFSSILPSLPPSLAASTLLPFSSLSSRGGGYG